MIAEVIPSVVGAAAAGALALGVYYPNNWLFGRVIGRGPRSGRTAYLTFDDGPNPTATDRILETLAAQGVPAAFFMVGAHVQRHPDIARRVVAAGHEVGNHTQHHVKLHVRGPHRIRRELEEAHGAITMLAGSSPRAFRAPHGYRNPFVAPATHRLGYRVFGWTFGVWDSARPGADEIRRRVQTHLRPGAIVLLHDGDGYDPDGDRSQTAAALPGIIQDARNAGYAFRPLAELLS
jgi:peptidoglycan/xylan/chitin deacetylase (PgdA/CDA1 family)